jgi:asparagine synthase (glutamine-hydrolysing)
MLSGGLDSSSIACTARNIFQQTKNLDLNTFSAIFPSLSAEDRKLIDERPYLEIVIATGGFIPHYIRADCLSPLADLDRVFWHIDEAFMGPNLYMHWALYKAANQQQVRVLLDGIDGDSTVSHGLAYLSDLARAGRWKALIRESRALARNYKMSVQRAVWQWGLQPLLLESFESIWQAFGKRLQPIGRGTVINPAFARRIQLAQHVETLSNGNSVPTRTSREQHWHSLNSGLLSYMLELADKSASAFSLEARYPFCDRRLLEFCLALPPEQKFSQGWTRLIARRAMAGILPPQVQRRICKANLGPNFKRKLLERERESLDEVILNQPQILQDYVDVSALRAAYHRFASQPMRERDSLTVYSAVNLALWLRRIGFAA